MEKATIPRGTCRLFGAIKAVSTIKNSAMLVHGPKGCVYHINYILGMRGDRPSQIYCTCLDDRDIIFGAEQKLVSAIEEIDTALHPDVLFVFSCCASAIIGEDVASAVQMARTGSRIIHIEAGGFEGDFRMGYSETLRRLVEVLVQKTDAVEPRSVNLVGMLRGGPDLRELKRILGGIGVRVHAVLTADETIERIEQMSSVALNIVLCEPSGKAAAELLQERCGTPFIIEELPIGYTATLRFLEHIREKLDMPPDLREPGECKPSANVSLRKRRVAIIGGPTRAVSMTRFLEELGVSPEIIVVDFDSGNLDRLEMIAGTGCEILVEPGHEHIMQALREHRIDLIFGGMLEKPIASAIGADHMDIMHGSQKTIGFEGACNLINLLDKHFKIR